ncbi:MAG: terpene cyclase/mutase family protein, partial [Acidobacteriota bacterium]|nr:terpene cyclase/mutase family protein [Acidobacteriota bacterium]
ERESARLRGVRYLWERQAQDGGWHSGKYGLLRSGQSLTPFVLDALLRVPHDTRNVDRAVGFIKSNTNSGGALGLMDPMIPDYPNYATALAVTALLRAGARASLKPMIDYLRGQQFTEQNGWPRDHGVYGAWGMGGQRRTPPDIGHVDLSMTRHVLQALAAAGVPKTDPAFSKALVYIGRLQNADGGFIFSTVEPDTNKAGQEGNGFRSYGTATADGILSLAAIGVPVANDRVQRAGHWLIARHQRSGASGFTGEAYRRWTGGLRYYYAGASSEAFRLLHERVDYDLTDLQRADGSWSNPENLVKEDDPLIATAFAIRALAD